jgi:hypothetical protein
MQSATTIAIEIESVKTEKRISLDISPRRTVGWLSGYAQKKLGLKDSVDLGLYTIVYFRYALVENRMKNEWERKSMFERHQFYALVFHENRLAGAYEDDVRLEDLQIQSGTVFYLYPIQIELPSRPSFATAS